MCQPPPPLSLSLTQNRNTFPCCTNHHHHHNEGTDKNVTAVLATRQVRETRIVKFHGVIFPRSKLLHPFRFGIERSCHSSTENCTDRLGLLHLLLSFFLNSLNRNYARETRPFLPPSYFFSFSLALGWRETYKYFIRSNWITGELLVISISLSLKRNHPLSFFPPPKGEKIPGNPLIL